MSGVAEKRTSQTIRRYQALALAFRAVPNLASSEHAQTVSLLAATFPADFPFWRQVKIKDKAAHERVALLLAVEDFLNRSVAHLKEGGYLRYFRGYVKGDPLRVFRRLQAKRLGEARPEKFTTRRAERRIQDVRASSIFDSARQHVLLDPRKAGDLVRGDAAEKLSELTRPLPPRQGEAVSKFFESLSEGYVYWSHRANALSACLTPAEMRNLRRARRAVPELDRILKALTDGLRRSRPRTRGFLKDLQKGPWGTANPRWKEFARGLLDPPAAQSLLRDPAELASRWKGTSQLNQAFVGQALELGKATARLAEAAKAWCEMELMAAIARKIGGPLQHHLAFLPPEREQPSGATPP